MGVQNRRKYDSDFKRNAVLLAQQPGRTVSDVARKLGIDSSRIYLQRKAFNKKGELAFPGKGKSSLSDDQKKIRELEKKWWFSRSYKQEISHYLFTAYLVGSENRSWHFTKIHFTHITGDGSDNIK